jgi:putative spermidine/putrescine transport system permease protein
MRHFRLAFLLLLPLAYLAVFFVLPILYLLVASLKVPSETEFIGSAWTLGNYKSILSDDFYQTIIGRTLISGFEVLGAALVLGYAAAFRISLIPKERQAWAVLCLLFPLMVSNVVRAYGWIGILGRNGALNSILMGLDVTEKPLSLLFTGGTVILGLLTILLPYMIISVLNALNTIDPRLREAAASLGASPAQTWFHVTAPLSSPGVVSGSLLVFLLTLGAYVTIALLGGPRFKLLVSLVFDSIQTFQWAKGAALAFILLALALSVSLAIIGVFRPDRARGGSK